MAKQILTDAIVKSLAPLKSGIRLVRDKSERGLAVRILPSGTRAFVLEYSAKGRRRAYTIGKFGEFTTKGARDKARELKDAIRFRGADPAQEAANLRSAPTMEELCQDFETDHIPKLRASTREAYQRMIAKDILPKLGKRKVEDITRADIESLHRSMTKRGAPNAANYCLALCRKLFNFAIEAELIQKNPAKGIKHNPVQARTRYLSKPEIVSLTKAMNEYPDQNVADIFRLLLLTGARKGETCSARWDQFDLKEGVWTKPSHATKQKREHRVPVSAPVRAVLVRRREQADAELKRLKIEIAKAAPQDRPKLQTWEARVQTNVFPAKEGKTGHIAELKKAWTSLCLKAGIARKGPSVARIHDLRHTAASILASSGASLPLIGQLLGHTQVATTQRYAHLFDDAQREAVDRLGALIDAGPSAEVIELKDKKRKRR